MSKYVHDVIIAVSEYTSSSGAHFTALVKCRCGKVFEDRYIPEAVTAYGNHREIESRRK